VDILNVGILPWRHNPEDLDLNLLTQHSASGRVPWPWT